MKAAVLARQNRDIEVKNSEIEQARQQLEDRAQRLDRPTYQHLDAGGTPFADWAAAS